MPRPKKEEAKPKAVAKTKAAPKAVAEKDDAGSRPKRNRLSLVRLKRGPRK